MFGSSVGSSREVKRFHDYADMEDKLPEGDGGVSYSDDFIEHVRGAVLGRAARYDMRRSLLKPSKDPIAAMKALTRAGETFRENRDPKWRSYLFSDKGRAMRVVHSSSNGEPMRDDGHEGLRDFVRGMLQDEKYSVHTEYYGGPITPWEFLELGGNGEAFVRLFVPWVNPRNGTKPRILRPFVRPNSIVYNLKPYGRASAISVSAARIVLDTFEPCPHPDMVVDVRDGDRCNLSVDNLFWRKAGHNRPDDLPPLQPIPDRLEAQKRLGFAPRAVDRLNFEPYPVKEIVG